MYIKILRLLSVYYQQLSHHKYIVNSNFELVSFVLNAKRSDTENSVFFFRGEPKYAAMQRPIIRRPARPAPHARFLAFDGFHAIAFSQQSTTVSCHQSTSSVSSYTDPHRPLIAFPLLQRCASHSPDERASTRVKGEHTNPGSLVADRPLTLSERRKSTDRH